MASLCKGVCPGSARGKCGSAGPAHLFGNGGGQPSGADRPQFPQLLQTTLQQRSGPPLRGSPSGYKPPGRRKSSGRIIRSDTNSSPPEASDGWNNGLVSRRHLNFLTTFSPDLSKHAESIASQIRYSGLRKMTNLLDRKSTRLNSSHSSVSRMPSSA